MLFSAGHDKPYYPITCFNQDPQYYGDELVKAETFHSLSWQNANRTYDFPSFLAFFMQSFHNNQLYNLLTEVSHLDVNLKSPPRVAKVQ